MTALCRLCRERPRAPRYTVCQRCRHGAPVPCPECGKPKRPESERCAACFQAQAKGPAHGAWKGGRVAVTDGYIRVYAPEHPAAQNGRYVLEHRLVMEEHLGRYLEPDERVHHKNGIRDDNRLENLEIWLTGHPTGARVEDALKWAYTIIARYEED